MKQLFARVRSSRHFHFSHLIAYAVALNGISIIAIPLLVSIARSHNVHISGNHLTTDAQQVLALALLYLSVLLVRQKRTAWLVTLVVYGVILLIDLERLYDIGLTHVLLGGELLLPALLVVSLLLARDSFTVRSDIRSFTFSLRIVALVLAVTFIYGVGGFMLMDRRDFHQNVSFVSAAHYTLDQFGVTHSVPLAPHTYRARLFVHSLSLLSAASVAYAFVSFFQPIRARLVDQTSQRQHARRLLDAHPASSEDFFKLWPHDKMYFFSQSGNAGLAYAVRGGVALVVGDPMGGRREFGALLNEFDDLCRTNDWDAAFIHIEPKFSELYKKHGLSLQKIGEEAVLDLAHFREQTARNKYFRQINNRFIKQGYATEVVLPPHDTALLARLQEISHAWLARPGRDERRFMLGHYSASYMQQCPLMLLRDGDGTIQAFINQIPSFDEREANFDLLRHTEAALGNANDFLLLQFINYLSEQGFDRLNLGLCPLAGLEKKDEQDSVVDGALRFVYANGDRFYSFSGLQRFKAKYEPNWQSRYVAYRGGLRGFTRTVNALNRAMKL